MFYERGDSDIENFNTLVRPMLIELFLNYK